MNRSELAVALLAEADGIRSSLDSGQSPGLWPQRLGSAESALRKAAVAIQESTEMVRHKDFTEVRDRGEMIDITPNITVEQARKIEQTLQARQSIDLSCAMLLKDLIEIIDNGGDDTTSTEYADAVAEARELLALHKAANAAFEAAIFQRT